MVLALAACPRPSPSPDPTPSLSRSRSRLRVRLLVAPPTEAGATSPADAVDDLAAWFAAHHVVALPNFDDVGACKAVRFGALDALVCTGGPPIQTIGDGESVYGARVAIWVDGGKATTPGTIAYAAGPLDSEVQPGQNGKTATTSRSP